MESKEYSAVVALAIGITVLMTGMVVWEYMSAAKFPGTIVIPAGNTYLGPNSPAQNTPTSLTASAPTVFTASADIPWHEVQGHLYPYTMSVPTTLTLTTFKNDKYDLYAIVWNNIDPSSNVLIGVDTTKAPLIDYVRGWWQQFSSLKGVAEIVPMTNSKGLKGYRAKYFNTAGATPNVDIFLSPPRAPQYVIHLSNGTLDPAMFDKIVDSVNWKL